MTQLNGADSGTTARPKTCPNDEVPSTWGHREMLYGSCCAKARQCPTAKCVCVVVECCPDHGHTHRGSHE